MKNNFLLRNTQAIKRYFGKMFLTQVTSILLFVFLVTLISQFNSIQTQNFLISGVIVIAYILIVAYYTYKFDITSYRLGYFPIDKNSDIVDYLRMTLKNIEKIYAKGEDLKYDTEKLLTDNILMRKEANAILASADLLKKISEAYKRILNLRIEIKETQKRANDFIFEIKKELENAEQGLSNRKVVEQLVYTGRVSEQTIKYKELKREEQKINSFQRLAAKELIG